MRSLDVNINGIIYSLACDDGQEVQVSQLADEVDMRARRIAKGMPQLHGNERMLLVMTCLTLADELYEARQEAGALHEHLSLLQQNKTQEPPRPPRSERNQPPQAQGNLFGAQDAQQVLEQALEEVAEKIEQIAGAIK